MHRRPAAARRSATSSYACASYGKPCNMDDRLPWRYRTASSNPSANCCNSARASSGRSRPCICFRKSRKLTACSDGLSAHLARLKSERCWLSPFDGPMITADVKPARGRRWLGGADSTTNSIPEVARPPSPLGSLLRRHETAPAHAISTMESPLSAIDSLYLWAAAAGHPRLRFSPTPLKNV